MVCALLGLATSCGYVMAGTWEDDPENWDRYFETTKPGDVVVVHSKYSRLPHWTLEFRCFFEIVPTAELTNQLFTQNRLRRLMESEISEAESLLGGEDVPGWFPEDLSRLEGWKYEGYPGSNFRLFVDPATGHLFMTDEQI
ncbi:MAG: hypothetical protein ACKVXR_01645 [Planctomycetota bacterium]